MIEAIDVGVLMARGKYLADARPHAPSSTPITAPSDAARAAAIVSAALELFATQGYQSTTMADIGEKVGIRGPSVYKHYPSKEALLAHIMLTSLEGLLDAQAVALQSTDDPVEQLRRIAEAHARHHAASRYEAFVGGREIDSLSEPHRSRVLELRSRYEHGFRDVIERGTSDGVFSVTSSKLASYAILDMGAGIAVWYRPDGPISQDEIARFYGDSALSLVEAKRLWRSPRPVRPAETDEVVARAQQLSGIPVEPVDPRRNSSAS